MMPRLAPLSSAIRAGLKCIGGRSTTEWLRNLGEGNEGYVWFDGCRSGVDFLATPGTSTGAGHLPAHVPGLGRRGPGQSFDDADAATARTVAYVMRFRAQVHVSH